MTANLNLNTISVAHPVVVLGRDHNGKAHASYFSAIDGHSARKAAERMGMLALQADNDDVRSLMTSIPKGKLFESGKAFVPFVKQALFDKLVTHLSEQDRIRAQSAPEAQGEAPGDNPATEGSPDKSDAESGAKLTVGTLVIAWEGEEQGWWEATIEKVIGNGLYTLRWRDYPEQPRINRTLKHIALPLHQSRADGAE